MSTLDEQFEGMVEEILLFEPANAMALIAKLFEEGGELAEATLFEEGFLKHKEPKESAVFECADVIIAALGVLVKENSMRGYNSSEIVAQLKDALVKKFYKYEAKVLHQNPAYREFKR